MGTVPKKTLPNKRVESLPRVWPGQFVGIAKRDEVTDGPLPPTSSGAVGGLWPYARSVPQSSVCLRQDAIGVKTPIHLRRARRASAARFDFSRTRHAGIGLFMRLAGGGTQHDGSLRGRLLVGGISQGLEGPSTSFRFPELFWCVAIDRLQSAARAGQPR